MSYKVFFVEDEIITREGIRDNVDWQASGFEFCGEAADGEMAPYASPIPGADKDACAVSRSHPELNPAKAFIPAQAG